MSMCSLSSGTDQPSSGEEKWLSAGRFAGGLGVLVFLTFPLILLGRETFYFRDFGVLAYPFIHLQREAFWEEGLLLWNPLSNCGAPFLAQWGTLSVYPLALIYLLLPLPWSLNLFGLLHLFLGGVGMHFLARAWTRDSFAGSVAGVAYAFAGVTTASIMWPNYLVALGWMPWIVFLGQCAFESPRRWVPIVAILGVMQMLSGVPEVILITWIVLGSVALVEVCRGRYGVGRFGITLCMLVLLVSALAAVQLLPFFELLSLSQRDYGFVSEKWSMPWWGWANLLVPLFHSFQTPQGAFVQNGQQFLSSYYPGIAVVALALGALWIRREPRVWLYWGLAVLGLVMAPGEQSPFYTSLRTLIPGIGVARYTIKSVFLTGFVLPLLAAWCVAQLSRASDSEVRGRLRTVGVIYAAMAVVAVAIVIGGKFSPLPLDEWGATTRNALIRIGLGGAMVGALVLVYRTGSEKRRRVLQGSVLILLWLELAFHWPQQNPTLSSDVFKPGLLQLQPRPQAGSGRVFIPPWAEGQLLRATVPDWKADFMWRRLELWSNLNALEGLPKVNGSSTLQVREQADVQSALYEDEDTSLPNLLDFLGATHVIRTNHALPWPWEIRPTALSWVTAGQKVVFSEGTNALAAVTSPQFRPREEVHLPMEAASVVNLANTVRVAVEIQQFDPHQVRFTTESAEPSVAVVAQSYYPHWRAWVDGEPATVWRANHAFQAVVFPAGRHEIRMEYRDTGFRLGLWISLASLSLCVFWLIREWKPGGKGKSAGMPPQ